MQDRLTCQQVSYDQLDQVSGTFDHVFSTSVDLTVFRIFQRHQTFRTLLKPGAFVTFVIMPPVSLWELLWILKGNPRQAFRRLHANGIKAHLEGEYFETYYHSLTKIKNAFGRDFELQRSEGLCSLSPPPSPAILR
jgi:hypothetical protein